MKTPSSSWILLRVHRNSRCLSIRTNKKSTLGLLTLRVWRVRTRCSTHLTIRSNNQDSLSLTSTTILHCFKVFSPVTQTSALISNSSSGGSYQSYLSARQTANSSLLLISQDPFSFPSCWGSCFYWAVKFTSAIFCPTSCSEMAPCTCSSTAWQKYFSPYSGRRDQLLLSHELSRLFAAANASTGCLGDLPFTELKFRRTG